MGLELPHHSERAEVEIEVGLCQAVGAIAPVIFSLLKLLMRRVAVQA